MATRIDFSERYGVEDKEDGDFMYYHEHETEIAELQARNDELVGMLTNVHDRWLAGQDFNINVSADVKSLIEKNRRQTDES